MAILEPPKRSIFWVFDWNRSIFWVFDWKRSIFWVFNWKRSIGILKLFWLLLFFDHLRLKTQQENQMGTNEQSRKAEMPDCQMLKKRLSNLKSKFKMFFDHVIPNNKPLILII